MELRHVELIPDCKDWFHVPSAGIDKLYFFLKVKNFFKVPTITSDFIWELHEFDIDKGTDLKVLASVEAPKTANTGEETTAQGVDDNVIENSLSKTDSQLKNLDPKSTDRFGTEEV
jgi:hypothetical protein